MILLIDNREPKSLINYLLSFKENNNLDFDYEIKSLDVGDYIIYDEKNKKNLVIFERKSLKDLEASIKDGRYNEQSYRLSNENIHNHNIYYIIEGSILNYKNTNFKNTLYSTLCSISYYKGFSIINSLNDIETIEIIYRFMNKILREKDKFPFYNIDINENEENIIIENNKDNYIDVIKSSKKSNITKENIDLIMLMQIPGVSVQSASAILNVFKKLKDLITNLERNTHCLDIIKLENNRKLSKNVIDNIKYYLLN